MYVGQWTYTETQKKTKNWIALDTIHGLFVRQIMMDTRDKSNNNSVAAKYDHYN